VLISELHPEPLEAARRAENVANKVLQALAQPYDLNGHGYECTVSIGVALLSDAGGLVEDILKRADMAMYEAKSQGRNTVRFFNPQMQQHMEARAALEADLREALAHSHFHLAYQPQVAIDGRVLGAEALLRWSHHTRGPVSPAQFIGVAEACGLILPIGHWVIQEACAQLVRWAEHPDTAGLRIAVNVSARQFRHAEFVNQVVAALRDSGANPHRLELELTESQLLDDVDGVIAKMSVLRAHGVNFSLDDFGTGYSSLTYLKRLPLYKLKIDQSFVRDLLTDPNDAAIVHTIVALGRSLDLEVIAEGVETEAQRQALAHAGCDEYQGYLFSRPLPAPDFQAWVSQRSAPPASA
jgi:predicted signal transduction protein with EAL and GGDEF domain